jgi:hypothetical protein
MENPIFLLAKDPDNECRDMIFHRDGTLRIRVYCLNNRQRESNPDELQLFANNKGEKLLFETVDYHPEDPGLVIEAIRWYAKYIGNPEMEIEAELEE